MRLKSLALFLFISVSMLYAQKEITMEDLLNNTFNVEDVYLYNHSCVCKDCKKKDFICTKLDDSPFLTLSAWLKQNPNVVVLFQIYIDAETLKDYGIKYTEQKAEELTSILLEFGVAQNQFSCKGLGYAPRTLNQDINGKKTKHLFPAGSFLDEKFMNNILTSVGYQEWQDAHLLNRRIEMKIISK